MKKQIILLTLLVSAVALLNTAQEETEQVTATKGFDRKDRIRQAIHKHKKNEPIAQTDAPNQPITKITAPEPSVDLGTFFTNDEYNEYMDLIKTIDPVAYNELKECATANAKPCLKKALTAQEEDIAIAPTSKTFRYSTMTLLPETIANTKLLSQCLDMYKKYAPHYFAKSEYDKYMLHIQTIDPAAYDALKKCEKANARPCLQKAINYTEEMFKSANFDEEMFEKMVKEPTLETHWYPTLIILPSFITNKRRAPFLSFLLDTYKSWMPTTKEERKKVLDIIKSITHQLYEDLIAIDPSGINHIVRYYARDTNGASVFPSFDDGFPIISIGSELVNSPDKYYTIGHELGHYALRHCNNKIQEASLAGIIGHKNRLIREHDLKKNNEQNPLKVMGQLNFKDTFNKAFNRIQEDEADRFAIVDLGIDLSDEVIKEMNKFSSEIDQKFSKENPKEKATFKQTHPFEEKRIEHMKSLSREVELHKRRYNNQPTPIDWQGLAQYYMNLFASQKKGASS